MIDEAVSLPIEKERTPERGPVADFDETRTMIRHQFTFDDYGTRAAAISPGIEVADENPPSHDALTRIEDKLHDVLRSIATLNRRIDSIDTVLARLVNR
jgi:hypothetical protein